MFLPKFCFGPLALLISSDLGNFYGSGALAHQKAFYEDKPLKHDVVSYHQASGNRSAKYFFPFALINFAPEPCSPTNQQVNEGVCLSKKRCLGSGGDTVGSCRQQRLGTCCKFTKQCTATMRAVTVVETVENLVSSNTAGSCVFVFPKEAGICQVRLDFTMLTLEDAQNAGPNAGNCQSESLTVSGADNIDGTLRVCGALSGQHMILTYGTVSDMISVTLQSETAGSTYNIRATQIPCNSADRVPDDCLQYFDSATAAIKSFGFPIQLNNQRYTICVRPTSGGNMLTWDKCTDTDAPNTPVDQRFKVSVPPTPPHGPCLTDWISIDNKGICGQEFPVMTTPLGNYARIRVNFDENETGNDVFYADVPALPNGMTPAQYCGTQAAGVVPLPLPPPFPVLYPPAQRPFCVAVMVGNQAMCMCRISNTGDSFTVPFLLFYDLENDMSRAFYCPKIEGFIASPETPSALMAGYCRYYLNVRVTDTQDTGFCLRYQAT